MSSTILQAPGNPQGEAEAAEPGEEAKNPFLVALGERARALRLLCRRIVVGEPANDVVWSTAKAPPKELLGLFEQAFTRGIGLGFDYSDRLGVASVRRIEPHGLLVKAPVWYVLARDCDKLAPRSFRMDRIASPRLLPAVTFRPDLEIVRELSARHNSYR
jgi:predicted DNA-binding transcriptional regulator YafY